MHYETLIDEETWRFIRETARAYPEDAVGLSIADQRRVYDQMCRVFYEGRPEGVSTEDCLAHSVPVRVYTAGNPSITVIYFHGGGFVVGGLDSHDDVCAEICAQTGYRVVSVDYRLCPEHTHPAAFDDSWSATQWVAEKYIGDLVLAGDSAGGNLAAAVAHYARGRLNRIVGQVLIYPGLGGNVDTGSYIDHAKAPMLTRDEILFYQGVRGGPETSVDDPTFLPLHDTDFSDLPPTVIYTADCDPVRDDGRHYRDRLVAADVLAHWVNEDGLVHGYLRARTTVARAQSSFERISLSIEALGQRIWPYA